MAVELKNRHRGGALAVDAAGRGVAPGGRRSLSSRPVARGHRRRATPPARRRSRGRSPRRRSTRLDQLSDAEVDTLLRGTLATRAGSAHRRGERRVAVADELSTPPPLGRLSPAERRALLAQLLRERRRAAPGRPPSLRARRRSGCCDQLAPGTGVNNVLGRRGAPPMVDRRARAQPRRDRRAGTRRCAPRSRSTSGDPVQVIAPQAEVALSARRPGRASHRGARAPRSSARAADVAAQPVRPRPRPAAPRELCSAWAPDDHVLLLTHAPHRLRRLVDGGAGAASCSRSTRPSRAGAAVAAAAAADPVRGLRRLAAASGCQGDVLEAQLALLARPPRRARRPARAAGRPAAPARRRATAGRAHALRRSRRRCRAALAALGQREGATLFMTLLAAFQALLAPLHAARTTSSSGTPIAGPQPRPRPRGSSASSSTRWCCAPTCSGDPTFRELLAPRAADVPSAPTPTRTCRSSGWSRSSQPERDLEPHAALPGDVRAPERARPRARAAAGLAPCGARTVGRGTAPLRPDASSR